MYTVLIDCAGDVHRMPQFVLEQTQVFSLFYIGEPSLSLGQAGVGRGAKNCTCYRFMGLIRSLRLRAKSHGYVLPISFCECMCFYILLFEKQIEAAEPIGCTPMGSYDDTRF